MKTLAFLKITAQVLVFTLMIGCQNSGKSSLEGEDGFDSDRYSDSSGLGSALGNGSGSSGGTGGGLSVGSGSGGAITQEDQNAFNNVLNNADKQAPQSDIQLDPTILNNIKNMLAAQKNGQDVSYQKMIIASQILQSCVQKVVEKAPHAGQTLLGMWGGVGQKAGCALSFEVKSNGKDQNSSFAVTGGTTGTLQGQQDGSGVVQGGALAGTLKDNPAGGVLTNPNFKFPAGAKGEASTGACAVNVALQQSKSPIPANYVEGMRQFGQCHRQALMLMSPVMSKLFDSLPGNTSSQLQSGLLGLGQQ